MTEAYPLQWPAGKPRTAYPKRAAFHANTFEGQRLELFRELKLLKAEHIVLSTNLALRKDGFPYSNRSQPADKGVAVYFGLKGKAMCFPCDKWDRIEDNLRAIVKSIEAIRGIERWGGGDMVEQAFSGFTALPAPARKDSWRKVFRLNDIAEVSAEDMKQRYYRFAKDRHPDNGGSEASMAELNDAYDTFKRERGIQ